MGFFDKIGNISGSNIIRKVLHWRSSKMFVTSATVCQSVKDMDSIMSILLFTTIICHDRCLIRWMCGVKLNDRKKSEELLRLEPVSLMTKKSRLKWFGHVERKDDNDRVKRCITWKVEGIRQRGRQQKTWLDCVKNDMESLVLSLKDAQSRNKWRKRIKGATG